MEQMKSTKKVKRTTSRKWVLVKTSSCMIGKRRTYKQTTLSNEFFKNTKLSNDSDSKSKSFFNCSKEKEDCEKI
jgi:hypothetical protein